MRVLAATAIAVVLAAIAGAAEAREASIYRGPCGEAVLPNGPLSVDRAIRVDTKCGTFAIDRQGVRYVGRGTRRPSLNGLLWLRGRLLFYERGRLVWRSPRWQGERPVAWTRTGRLVYWRGETLIARQRSGRTLARFRMKHPALHRFDPRTRTVLFVSPRGELVRTDGRVATTVASLGLGAPLEIVPLEDERVALLGRRLVVLGREGSVVASDRRRGAVPVVSSHGAIALISTARLDERGLARESVRLLRPGWRSSTSLFVNEVGALGCGHWPSLEWRGDELLYSTAAGDVVVIDAGSGTHLDLTAVIRRLPGEFVAARWA